ncbi:Il1b [Columba livia]|nr:Il1b [Columba livia]
MAFVPDLDTLESSSLNEETFYGPNCLCLQKKPRLDLEATSPGVGIQVMATKGHPTRTFRRAAVLMVAISKLLKRPAHKDFADSDLGDFLDDIFVKLNIALYRPRSPQDGLGSGRVPVALGIKGYQLYMSCVLSGAEPVLQLEEADIRRDIESVELTRFIFYRLDSPTEGTTRFESAAFPGWFICTSLQPRQPVGITDKPDQVNIATYALSGH